MSTHKTIIAVDVMGGDHGLAVTLPACAEFLRTHPDASLLLVGEQTQIENALPHHKLTLSERCQIVHASEVVEMHEAVESALRRKKDSSMRVAINMVKEGRAHAVVSAGNTGALMAISRFVLKTLPGIDRPAICAIMPTISGHTHILDLGANVDCTPENLLQFGLMGASLVAAIERKEKPTVGLLNIGEEEIKGNEMVKQAAELLKASGLNFVGNVEGDGIYKGEAEVIVCDGFVGNVALKTAEGLAQMLSSFLRQEFGRNLLTRLIALLALPVLKNFKKRVDHRRYNGATLLGLKGVVIKSHGSADVFSFNNALKRAAQEARSGVLARISERIALQQQQSQETEQTCMPASPV